MTQLLEKTISEIRKLSTDEQDAIAAVLMAELESERRWERALTRQQTSCPALQMRHLMSTGRARLSRSNRMAHEIPDN